MILTSRFFRPGIAAAVLLAAAIVLSAAASSQARSARPATASARKIAPASALSFADVTRASGIDFHLTCGGLEKRYIIESMCGGV
ncbi:MAG TPA: hypothetical protein VN868_02760, partial [Terriglobales bacterium]|nr:hypothetical protein [Terriglobales bacterium]